MNGLTWLALAIIVICCFYLAIHEILKGDQWKQDAIKKERTPEHKNTIDRLMRQGRWDSKNDWSGYGF